jgi:hypothetical protein
MEFPKENPFPNYELEVGDHTNLRKSHKGFGLVCFFF